MQAKTKDLIKNCVIALMAVFIVFLIQDTSKAYTRLEQVEQSNVVARQSMLHAQQRLNAEQMKFSALSHNCVPKDQVLTKKPIPKTK